MCSLENDENWFLRAATQTVKLLLSPAPKQAVVQNSFTRDVPYERKVGQVSANQPLTQNISHQVEIILPEKYSPKCVWM